MLGFTPVATRPLSDIPVPAGGAVTINHSIGSYIWAASTAVILPLIFSTPGTYSWAGTTSGVTLQPITINHSAGAYGWSGTNASGWGTPVFSPNGGSIGENPISFAAISAGQTQATSLDAIIGAYSWIGTTSTLSSAITATPGAYSWAGTTSIIESLIYASPGIYTWAGTTSVISSLILGTPGTYSWDGVTATITQNISSAPGSYTWVGIQADIGGTPVTISHSIGAWNWLGTTAQTSQMMNASVAQYGWNGTNATISEYDTIRINGIIGNYSWAGLVSVVNPVTSTVGTNTVSLGSGGGQRINRHQDFIIHKHEPKPYAYPFKMNMENQDRQDIADILAMLEDSGLLD